MIEEYTLKSLLEKHNINADKLIYKNNNILAYGEYQDIDATLNYLINELEIDRSNIEKCPSILYRNVGDIKTNVNFIKDKKVRFEDVETCLHVLSTESHQLTSTYDYVEKNYGIDVINKITSILCVPKYRIISIENLNIPLKNKNDVISISIGSNSIEEIQDIINSKEFKEHPELFTSTTLAYAKLKDIQDIINSKEFKEHPELFTSTVLAHAKLKDIRALLELPYWEDEKYRRLLTSSILAKSKSMIKKLPVLFKMAEDYGIDNYLNVNFLRHSPSQNYALINYLIDNDILLVIDYKLNSIFSYHPGVLKKKYNIDIKQLMKEYPLLVYESVK